MMYNSYTFWTKLVFSYGLKATEKEGTVALVSKRSIVWFLFLFALAVYPAAVMGQGPGKWTVRAPLPSPRTEVAAVQLSGKIFVIGGLGKSGDLLEEYDPSGPYRRSD